MNAKKVFGVGLLLFVVGMMSLTAIPSVHADPYQTTWVDYHVQDIFGQTVLTTNLTQYWMYNGSAITWFAPPQYTWVKPWWLVWAYSSGLKTGTWVIQPYSYNIAWGTGHWDMGIPTPWGNIVLTQSVYSEIGYCGNGSYWYTAGPGYISS